MRASKAIGCLSCQKFPPSRSSFASASQIHISSGNQRSDTQMRSLTLQLRTSAALDCAWAVPGHHRRHHQGPLAGNALPRPTHQPAQGTVPNVSGHMLDGADAGKPSRTAPRPRRRNLLERQEASPQGGSRRSRNRLSGRICVAVHVLRCAQVNSNVPSDLIRLFSS
jgi:hypothetical protein